MLDGMAFLFTAAAALCLVAAPGALPDVLLPGTHRVTHEVMFVESELLGETRLIAGPLRGFGGFIEVAAGEPFSHSSKYGTRVYSVPREAVVESADDLRESSWPSVSVQVGYADAASRMSPVHRRRTVVELVAASEDEIRVEVRERIAMDSSGQPVDIRMHWVKIAAVAAAGLLLLAFVWRSRSKRARAGAE